MIVPPPLSVGDRLLKPQLAIADILAIGPPAGTKSAALNTIVEKFGRTTGYTRGYVDSVSGPQGTLRNRDDSVPRSDRD